uniref:protein disulfide-isomerase n=1 Tax=Denticeps clupeoides TaxID=299321 RepID=A0AAY4C4V4_9TELE
CVIKLTLRRCVCAGGTEPGTITEENGVLLLTKSNFKQALGLHQQLLVHFYAPLSGDAMGSIMEFSKAAKELKDTPITTKLGRVDVTKQKELAEELNVTMVPSMRLYLSGDKHSPIQCPVLKHSTAILTWLQRREGPSAEVLADLSQSETFLKSHDLVVLGLFKDVKRGPVDVFYSVAGDVADLPFGVTDSDEVFRTFQLTSDSVLLLKESKLESTFEVSEETTKEDLITFIRIHEFELVTEYTGKTASQILSSLVMNHLLLFINKTEKNFPDLHHAFQTTAAHFRGQILFVLVDADEPRNGRVMEYFHVRAEDTPTVRMVNLTDHLQYQLQSDRLDTLTLTHFCQEYLLGRAKVKMHSEPVPEDWDKKPVKELVGLNFERVVFNDKNNVLVLFYSGWNAESRALFPLWEELAQRFRNHDNVVIARLDATLNDINIRTLEKPPSIRLFPAVYAERVRQGRGRGTWDGLDVPVVDGLILISFFWCATQEERERKKYIEVVKAAEAAEKEKDEL